MASHAAGGDAKAGSVPEGRGRHLKIAKGRQRAVWSWGRSRFCQIYFQISHCGYKKEMLGNIPLRTRFPQNFVHNFVTRNIRTHHTNPGQDYLYLGGGIVVRLFTHCLVV